MLHANCDKVIVIDESTRALSLSAEFRFIGECDVTVDELLGCFSRRDVLGEAKQLLSSLLLDTAQPSKPIAEKAQALNISERTLKKAKKELGIVAEKIGDNWFCKLPQETKMHKVTAAVCPEYRRTIWQVEQIAKQ